MKPLALLVLGFSVACLFSDDEQSGDAGVRDVGLAGENVGGDGSGVPDSQDAARPIALELYVDFEAVEGRRVLDRSGNERHGTLGQGATITALGRVGRALQLSGAITQSVDFGDILDGLQAMTIELWVRSSGPLSGWNAVLSNFTVADGYWLGTALGTNGNAEWKVRSWAMVSVGQPFDGSWNHIAVTYDADPDNQVFALYLNGVEDTRALWGRQEAPNAGGVDLVLGTGGVGRSPFTGAIDELKIWSVVRTDAEICADAGGDYSFVGGLAACHGLERQ